MKKPTKRQLFLRWRHAYRARRRLDRHLMELDTMRQMVRVAMMVGSRVHIELRSNS